MRRHKALCRMKSTNATFEEVVDVTWSQVRKDTSLGESGLSGMQAQDHAHERSLAQQQAPRFDVASNPRSCMAQFQQPKEVE